jgi:hypothetical protein
MITLCCIALGMHIGTYHFDRGRNYREFNPGAYVRVDRWQAGAYNNSHGKLSVYGTYAVPLAKRIDLAIGAATGYNGSIVPVVVLTYSFDAGPRLGLIPSSPKGGSGGVHLAHEFNRGTR